MTGCEDQWAHDYEHLTTAIAVLHTPQHTQQHTHKDAENTRATEVTADMVYIIRKKSLGVQLNDACQSRAWVSEWAEV